MKFKNNIPGWMSQEDLNILAKLSSLVPDNSSIAEIGSFLGRSTSTLFLNKKESVNLTVIDKFEIEKGYSLNVPTPPNGDVELFEIAKKVSSDTNSWQAGFKYCLGDDIYNQLSVHTVDSNNFEVDKEYSMVFIDGDHSPIQVSKDIAKFLNDSILIVGDDFNAQHIGVIQGLLSNIKGPNGRTLLVPKNTKIWILIPNQGYWSTLLTRLTL
jgi:hypothetical protein